MDKNDVSHVEIADNLTRTPTGHIELLRNNEVILVPTPSADPRDPLNLPAWRKWVLLVLVSAYSCTSVVLASGMGSISSVVKASYPGQEDRANDLLTHPTLFMGVGNLVSMPLAYTIGRRPVFLASIILLIAGGIWCQCSTSLSSHIAGRDIMSLAAGQSEALSPMIIQEIHFLHERGRKLSWFITIQNLVAGVFFVVSTYMVSAWGGWRWWYGFFTIMNAVILVFSWIFVSESRFERPEEAMRGEAYPSNKFGDDNVEQAQGQEYGPRCWRDDLKLLATRPNWSEIPTLYKQVFQGLLIPTILWLLLLNGAHLGVYVFQASTFSSILMASPYSFSFTSLGYVQAGQIVCCLIFLPLLGYGSDFIIRLFTKRNNGLFKPEYRLPVIAIPAIVGVICGIIYGQAGTNPGKWSAAAVVIGYNASFFAFLGANIVGITYAVDSFPLRAAPFLVVICAGRGIISFGLSYATLPAVKTIGYSGTMIAEEVICGVLSLIAIPMFFLGPRIRSFVGRWCGSKDIS
ncbi:hypothetical protein N7532_007308 [Penicillium argentinense]|uniref:Major facilitator superfamily (MFS) profile domain-containing protein n=1 Tax=Penicillium argentinense TaxID=1131581 RepID=A0A9W9F7P1_9EURO|nr:uncharacterized protein N7532_007308 [Penicillium argentinense]KAJ5095017.1 hypothetical protein N7532_007308 [Penicillium argentinense]